MSECRNGQERCGGPWGADLPCFACYMDRHRALVPVSSASTEAA